jgi:hypothetical protein
MYQPHAGRVFKGLSDITMGLNESRDFVVTYFDSEGVIIHGLC